MKWLIQNQNSHSMEDLELFSNHSEKFNHSPSRRAKMSLSSMCVPSIFLYALPTMPGHAPRCTQLIFGRGRAVHKSIMSELMTRKTFLPQCPWTTSVVDTALWYLLAEPLLYSVVLLIVTHFHLLTDPFMQPSSEIDTQWLSLSKWPG